MVACREGFDGFDIAVEFLADFANQGGAWRFVGFDFAAGENGACEMGTGSIGSGHDSERDS